MFMWVNINHVHLQIGLMALIARSNLEKLQAKIDKNINTNNKTQIGDSWST
jgi:hypothetical protein